MRLINLIIKIVLKVKTSTKQNIAKKIEHLFFTATCLHIASRIFFLGVGIIISQFSLKPLKAE